MSSPIDAINALRAKYDAQEVGDAAPAPYGQQAQQAPATNTFGNDGLSLSKELSKEQAAQQLPKANDGSGAMWAAFGINLGLGILGKLFGGGGQGGGGDEEQQAGGCSGGG